LISLQKTPTGDSGPPAGKRDLTRHEREKAIIPADDGPSTFAGSGNEPVRVTTTTTSSIRSAPTTELTTAGDGRPGHDHMNFTIRLMGDG
jgi:hypothetical protein